MFYSPQTCICRAFQACIRKATSALAAGHRRAPVSCRAYLCPPLRSGLRASGLQRRQGARSLRDRQPPTALPALDRTSTRRHGATNRPKGPSGPSACKITCCGQGEFLLRFWLVVHIKNNHYKMVHLSRWFLPGKESRCAIMSHLGKKWSTGRLLEALKTEDGWNILLVFDVLCSTGRGQTLHKRACWWNTTVSIRKKCTT